MTSPNLLSPRFYFPFHSRRNNRRYPSKLIARYCTTRHLLCSSTLPLCIINGGSICYHGRTYPLISTIHGVLAKPNFNKNSILSNIHRSKHNILSTTLPRPIGHTTPILRFPRCLYPMKHSLINRFNYLTNRRIHITLHCMGSYNLQTKPAYATREKNPCRMILRYTPTISHPHRTNIHIKQHICSNP